MENIKTEIAILQEISSAVVHERNIQKLMEQVLEIISRKMGMVCAALTLRHGDIFEIDASFGLDHAAKKRGRYELGEGITGQVAATGIPCLVPNVLKDKRFLSRTKKPDPGQCTAFLCVPITHHERVVGTLSIECENNPGTNLESYLSLLEIVGNLMADVAATRAKEHEEREQLLATNQRLREVIQLTNPGKLVGNCRSMQQVYRLIRQVAPTNATVLIRGSSGTGKELVAQAIRQLSNRADKPMVTLNCAAIPEELVESEFFGHEKGAFTGASERRIGRAEAADGGTIFLDEIGDLSLTSQVKLLRFIQERTFSRVGSNKEIQSDVRIIAATSRNLEKLMEEGKFREDLYYRLNIFPIYIPDLSKHRCDIILLAEHFIEKYNLRYNTSIKGISPPAVNLLMAYHWPGNIRELENCIERAVLTATDDTIHSYNLPPSLQTEISSTLHELPQGTKDFKTLVESFERELLMDALKRHKGNMSAAARELSLSPRMIHYKINHLGISAKWYTEKKEE
ncbi:MAG: sigma 54-interacting transcriptional regulator [Planctomycetia bacterium]|nr:sigma 54-interacting transcriptional regulator [Planctomycetia bacterium]